VSVRLGRLEGVESVHISLNDGRAALTLEADNTVRLAQVYTIVRQAGFTPREARVTARATVRLVKERALIEIVGTSESFTAFPSEGVETADLTTRAGTVVLVEGIIEAPNATVEPRIAVTSIDDE
jgi:hypothetical protein